MCLYVCMVMSSENNCSCLTGNQVEDFKIRRKPQNEYHIIMKSRVLQREIIFVVMIIKERSSKLLLPSKIPYLKQQTVGTKKLYKYME